MSNHGIDIAGIRKDYRLASLDETIVGDDPIAFFNKWFAEANVAEISEVNAMTLATIDKNNAPHARIVLLKGLDDGFVFYTNYDSAKGQQLEVNTKAALVFFWKELERQVRIEGVTEKVSEKESDIYFSSRPPGSRLGTWASPQSQVILNRDILDNNYIKFQEQYKNDIPRPPFWGGYRIVPNLIEFWQGRSNRMHDRILFTITDGSWKKSRLAP